MKPSTLIIIIVFIFVLFSYMDTSPSPKSIDVLKNNYARIAREEKPLLIYFYTDRCYYCKEFGPVIYEVAENYKLKYFFLTIDANSSDNYELCRNFKVNGVPAVYLVNTEAKKIKKMPHRTKPEIESELNNFINNLRGLKVG